MSDIVNMLFVSLLFFLFFLLPCLISLWNVFLLFAQKKIPVKLIAAWDIVTVVLGIFYTYLLAAITDFHHWNEQLHVEQGPYSPISVDRLPTFFAICLVAITGYLLLRFWGKKLSPVLASICYGGMFLGFCLTAVLTIQFFDNPVGWKAFYFLAFPYNYVLCSVRLMRNTVTQYAQTAAQTQYKNPFLRLCHRVLSHSSSFMLVSFLLIIPLLLIITVILLLFGQQPDSVIKMFTETAEWTLSQEIPPPRLDYDQHYLCTVAACGDAKVVKPLRAGKRRNQLIVVNRQLLVANAFEDLLAEKTPRLHKIIRQTYDRIGLPLSKYITTKRRSNLVYILMKPLEWLFVVVLYLFDTKPENRIHRQYLQ